MKPMIVFDLETTGTDVAKDRIVSLAAIRISDSPEEIVEHLFNPGIEIPAEVSAIHGITNEAVQGKPEFKKHAKALWQFFEGADVAGYNIANFDVPLLWEEFYRNGLTWNVGRIVDACVIFKKKEERTLTAAVKFYCAREHEDAHSALGDVRATLDVLKGQRARYADVGGMTGEQLAEFCRTETRVDLGGKIVLNAAGEPIYNIGKAKGTRVVDDAGFGQWMLRNNFSQNTKMHLRKILA